MADALWHVLSAPGAALADMLVFLPSRRAVRTVEKMIATKMGGAAVLPRLVALGEGDDDAADDVDDVIGDMRRVVMTARLLAADAAIGNVAAALPVARDLVRMTDYLENEGIDIADVDWNSLVGEQFAAHFQHKARLLNIVSAAARDFGTGNVTVARARNRDIRAWIDTLDMYSRVVVCASTASVPATADLMAAIAARPHGRIILSGKISGRECDFALASNPYNCEYKFLQRIGLSPDDVIAIDVGPSAIDFMNAAFGNDTSAGACDMGGAVEHCHLVECERESQEAAAVAQIADRAVKDGKSVLVITPDAAGNQRIATALRACGIAADFSGGVSGAMTAPGRAILNRFDEWIECGGGDFDAALARSADGLFGVVAEIVDNAAGLAPQFAPDDSDAVQIWRAIREMSDAVRDAGIVLDASAARALVADAIGTVSVRGAMNDAAPVVVLGTIESRMQTADVVILTGLNEGMFPTRGYENAWLPRRVAEQIGLPPGDRKVSLMSLDFMNLSCGADVYWTRSRVSGGVQTTQSRFLSRVIARRGRFDTDAGAGVLAVVRARDCVASRPLDYSPPSPPADWSDVYVTELELLIHNPYAFYARHILRLRPMDDYWMGPDARAFGTLVHSVIENARDIRPDALVFEMDRRAREILRGDSVMFRFWHKRFLEIASVVAREMSDVQNAVAEIAGAVRIAGRTVHARADRVWSGGVMDVKTGAAPTAAQLAAGNMPQLPLEAYMLKSGGFPMAPCAAPVMRFLQLKNGDVKTIEYDAAATAQMMNAAVDKVTELFNIYAAGGAPYEYRETSDKKYRAYDDLARVMD